MHYLRLQFRVQNRNMKTLAVLAFVLLLVIAVIALLRRTRFQLTSQSPATASSSPAKWSSNDVSSGTALRSLRYGFDWISPSATITVELNLNHSTMAAFLEVLYNTQSKRLQITCPKPEIFGTTEFEAGWYVCLAEPFNLVKPCLVYSFGMGNQSAWSTSWSFDETVTKKYGCQDMAYDPTIDMQTSRVNELMWFFNVGLSGKDNPLNKTWPVKTLETLLKENNHIDRTIDILKIDVECSEWSAFDAILASPKYLAKVKQLLVEFHVKDEFRPCGQSTAVTSHQFASYLRTFREIERLGFKRWRVWNNPRCMLESKRFRGRMFYGCHNVYYLNVNYLT